MAGSRRCRQPTASLDTTATTAGSWPEDAGLRQLSAPRFGGRRFSCDSEGTRAPAAPPSRWSRAILAAGSSCAPRRAEYGCGRNDTRTGLRRKETHSASTRSAPTWRLNYASSVALLRRRPRRRLAKSCSCLRRRRRLRRVPAAIRRLRFASSSPRSSSRRAETQRFIVPSSHAISLGVSPSEIHVHTRDQVRSGAGDPRVFAVDRAGRLFSRRGQEEGFLCVNAPR
jgi:hypothetical protein